MAALSDRSAAEPSRRARWLRTAQCVAVPVGLMVLLWLAIAHRERIRPVGSAWLPMLAMLLAQASLLLVAIRFHLATVAMGIRIPARTSARIALQSLFYMFFLPFGAGAEVSRWVKLRRAAPATTRTQAVATIALDRVTPFVACLAIFSACLPLLRNGEIASAIHGVRPSQAAPVLAALLLIAAIAAIRWRSWLWNALVPLRSGERSQVMRLTAMVAISVAVQLSGALELAMLGWWLGAELPLPEAALASTGAMLAQVLPLSIAGAGTGELGMALLLTASGIPGVQAIMLTTASYLAKLVVAIECGLLEWPGWNRPVLGDGPPTPPISSTPP